MVKPARPAGGYLPPRAQPTDENSMISPNVAGPSRHTEPVQKAVQPVPAKSFYAPQMNKSASKIIIGGDKSAKEREAWGGAVFNPDQEGAVLMARPTEEEAKKRSVTNMEFLKNQS